MNEETFIRRLAAVFHADETVHTGIGDDAAVLRLSADFYLLAAADQLLSSVHLDDSATAHEAGAKLLKRNLSDIAAMGGIPLYALLTIAARPMNDPFLLAFHLGLEEAARAFGVSVVGGDLAELPHAGFVSSLTILGRVEPEKLCLRSGARPGDLLYATGAFGNSFRSGRHLSFTPRLRESAFLAGSWTRAMMDVSDGLLKDAARFAEASGLEFELDPSSVPLHPDADPVAALSDGEDYELLFAVNPTVEGAMRDAFRAEGQGLAPFSRVGRFLPGENPGFCRNLPPQQKGFDHFHDA